MGGIITFFCRKFLSQCLKCRRGPLLCWTKTLVSKKVRDKRGREFHDFPSNYFVSVLNHLVEEFFCVSECFEYRKEVCLRGEHHDFLYKSCCLTVAKNFVAEPFCVSQKFWYRKRLEIKGGGQVSRFSVKLFCLTVLNHLAEECFCVSESLGYRKNLCLRGEHHDFL